MAKRNGYAEALKADLEEGTAEVAYSAEDGCLYLPQDFFGAFTPKKGDNVSLSLKVEATGDTIKLKPESFNSHTPFPIK